MEVKSIRQRIAAAGYLELVDAIFDLRPDAVIAGGFVRDLLNDKAIRDIDVLVLDNHGLEDAGLADSGTLLGDFTRTFDLHYENAREGDSETLREVWKNKLETVEFLVVTSVEGMIADFPDDISAAWMVRNEDKTFTVDFTEAYEAAHRDHAIRIGKRLLNTRGERRIAKLHAKYQDYSVELRAGE